MSVPEDPPSTASCRQTYVRLVKFAYEEPSKRSLAISKSEKPCEKRVRRQSITSIIKAIPANVKQLSLDPSRPENGSWVRLESDTHHVRCKACEGFNMPLQYACMHALRRHQNSKAHIENCIAMGAGLQCKTKTPTMDEFRSVLHERRKGISHQQSSSEVAYTAKKLKKLA